MSTQLITSPHALHIVQPPSRWRRVGPFAEANAAWGGFLGEDMMIPYLGGFTKC